MIQKISKKLPELAVILFCMIILAFGVSRKEGYHMDELLSFELSNGEFNPWIVPTQPEGRLAKYVHNEIDGENLGETLGNLFRAVGDVLKNGGSSVLLSYKADVYEEPVWIAAEQFRDYIEVDGKDAFNYLSVYFNVKDDNHPPIHFMLLHTMSSLFQERVAPFMGCVINLLAVAAAMILLMKIGKMLAEELGLAEWGRLLGLFAALLYGSSAGALASVLLIRMYCLLTCLCVALCYYHLKKWQEGAFGQKNKGMIAVTVLGFLTQYFFLFYCLVLAAATAVLLWRNNRKKELGVYIRSMLLAGVIGVGCFPFSIAHVFSSGRGVEALENLSSGLAGYGSRLAEFWGILADRTYGILLLGGIVILTGIFLVHFHKKEIVWLLIVPAAAYFLLAARMSPYLVDRYIMAVFPFVILIGLIVLAWGVWEMGRRFRLRQALPILCGGLFVFQLLQLARYDGAYLYRGYEKQQQAAEEYGEYSCICVYDGVGYYENLLEFTEYEKTLLVTYEELANRRDADSLLELEEAVVLIKCNVDREQVCEVLKNTYGLLYQQDLLDESVYGDSLCLFVRG